LPKVWRIGSGRTVHMPKCIAKETAKVLKDDINSKIASL